LESGRSRHNNWPIPTAPERVQLVNLFPAGPFGLDKSNLFGRKLSSPVYFLLNARMESDSKQDFPFTNFFFYVNQIPEQIPQLFLSFVAPIGK